MGRRELDASLDAACNVAAFTAHKEEAYDKPVEHLLAFNFT